MTFIAAPPKLTEKRFQRQVVELALLLGWRVRHDAATNQRRTCRQCSTLLRCATCGTPPTIVRNAAGMPDLLLTRRPRIVWAELKSDRGTLSSDQLAMLTELRACGQEAYVWKPRDFQTIERILR